MSQHFARAQTSRVFLALKADWAAVCTDNWYVCLLNQQLHSHLIPTCSSYWPVC